MNSESGVYWEKFGFWRTLSDGFKSLLATSLDMLIVGEEMDARASRAFHGDIRDSGEAENYLPARCNVLLCGEQGSGKSSVGNTISAEDIFPKSGNTQKDLTKEYMVVVKDERHTKFRINLIDGPGIIIKNDDPTTVRWDRENPFPGSARENANEINVFVVVLNARKSMQHDWAVIEALKTLLGADFLKKAICVYTHHDKVCVNPCCCTMLQSLNSTFIEDQRYKVAGVLFLNRVVLVDNETESCIRCFVNGWRREDSARQNFYRRVIFNMINDVLYVTKGGFHTLPGGIEVQQQRSESPVYYMEPDTNAAQQYINPIQAPQDLQMGQRYN